MSAFAPSPKRRTRNRFYMQSHMRSRFYMRSRFSHVSQHTILSCDNQPRWLKVARSPGQKSPLRAILKLLWSKRPVAGELGPRSEGNRGESFFRVACFRRSKACTAGLYIHVEGRRTILSPATGHFDQRAMRVGTTQQKGGEPKPASLLLPLVSEKPTARYTNKEETLPR